MEVLTGALVLITAVYAFLTWRLVQEASRTRKAQTRPYVVVDWEPSKASPILADIVVSNVGATPAYDVTFAFDPALSSSMEDYDIASAKFFSEGVPMMAPNRTHRVFWDRAPDRINSGLPLSHSVEVRYRNDAGTEFTDSYLIDMNLYVDVRRLGVKDVHDIARELEQIRQAMQ